MARLDSMLLLLISSLLLSSWAPLSHCAKKPVVVARKEDIAFIKCQVCEKLASELYQQVHKKQSEISPKKISEFQIIEIAENVCNLKKAEADWILKIDIVEHGDKLKLVEHDTEGQCNSECKTIERACQDVMGYSDTDISEYLYKNKPEIGSVIKFLCTDLTKVCSSKPPPVPKDRTPGEPFVPKAPKEAEMERLLKSMQGMPGAPNMKMYSREELMNKNSFGGENGDEDDDEEDEDEADFPSKLGQVLRNKKSPKDDWKQKISKGITDTREGLKKHASKVSYRLKKWWNNNKSSKTGKSEL